MKRKQIIETIKKVLTAHGVGAAYLFGSFARKERRVHDIDVAIKPPTGKFSLLDLIGVEQELQDKTGEKIDLVIIDSIKSRLRPYIEKDLVSIL